ncbi:MAG: PAS domain-containing sensor histidine kinase [Bacteroidales bacterium]
MKQEVFFITDSEGNILSISDDEFYTGKYYSVKPGNDFRISSLIEEKYCERILNFLKSKTSDELLLKIHLREINQIALLKITPLYNSFKNCYAYHCFITLSLFQTVTGGEILNQIPRGIFLAQKNGELLNVNEGFILLIGYQSGFEWISKNIFEFLPDKNVRLFINEPGLVNQIDTQMVKKDGSLIWVRFFIMQILNNNADEELFQGYLEDISSQVLQQKMIEESETKLKELNRSKDKLFSIISHDLRSPINQFVGATELLLNKLDEYDKEMIRNFLTLLNSEAIQSARLLENLLQWSKSQRGLIKYDPRPIQMLNIVNDLLPIYKPMATAKNISIEINISKSVYAYADKEMISTILRNLISNAIKFTGNNGTIEISARKKNEHEFPFDEYVEFQVKDNGIGISKEVIPKLFNLINNTFSRETYEDVVTGLGLILCREFVEKHNGKIWVESEPGKGSTFYFTIY